MKPVRVHKLNKGLLSVLLAFILMLVILPGRTANAAGGSMSVTSSSDDLTVTFLDVGQGDAAVVQCGGQSMIIDGGKPEKSSLIYSWLKKNGISYLDYMIATHPDADHIGGLSGALNYARVGTAYCSTTSGDTKTFRSLVKYLKKQGQSLQVPDAGETFALGSAEVEILGPAGLGEGAVNNNRTRYDSGSSRNDHTSGSNGGVNDSSIVLRVTYGKTSFLFTGDAEREEEQELLSSGYDLQSTVLKVGHHGSATSTSYLFLRTVNPQYAVISVGADNSYGHPTEEVLSRLRDAGVKTYRTDLQGTITAVSDGRKVTFRTEKNPDADTLAGSGAGQNSHSSGEASSNSSSGTGTESDTSGTAETSVASGADAVAAGAGAAAAGATSASSGAAIQGNSSASMSSPVQEYVLNTNTHKFHYPSCSSVNQMKAKNKQVVTESRDEIISLGYKPCKRCNP